MIDHKRQESIIKLFNKYESEPAHSQQVTKLALILFDKTKGIVHNLSENERDLLEAGALLHDIGYYISADKHNKNAYKLIMKNDLPGFSQEEKQIIANIARYHRGKLPRKKHNCYNCLSNEAKSAVNKLGALVRLADGLDRTHRSVINDLEFTVDFKKSTIIVFLKLNTPDCSFEILKAQDKKDFFEKEFGLKLKFKV